MTTRHEDASSIVRQLRYHNGLLAYLTDNRCGGTSTYVPPVYHSLPTTEEGAVGNVMCTLP